MGHLHDTILTKNKKLLYFLGVHLHGNAFWGPENANL